MIEAFHRDAVLLLAQGYEPAGQNYVEGQWGIAWGLVALLLTPILVGLIIWVPILTTRPTGTLTVTYVYRAAAHGVPSTAS
jgi:cytochrome b subunit of formate dehydrogenase